MQRPDRLQLPPQQAQDSPRERERGNTSNYALSRIRMSISLDLVSATIGRRFCSYTLLVIDTLSTFPVSASRS